MFSKGQPAGCRPQRTGHADQREVLAPDRPRARGRRSRRSVSPISRRSPEHAELSDPTSLDAGAGRGMGGRRLPGLHQAGERRPELLSVPCSRPKYYVGAGSSPSISRSGGAFAPTLENRWLSGAPPSGAEECGGDPNAYVLCDGPYMVQLADPGINPPNLAAVQEVSAGIYRVAGSPAGPEAELWVDDIRLSGPVSEIGTAMAVDTRLHRIRCRQRERLLHPPGRAVSSDQQRSRPIGPPAHLCWARTGGSTGFSPPRSVFPFRSASPTTGPTWTRSCSPAPTSGATH